MTRGGRAQRGFTLLEVMAAVAILALTLVVLLDVITNNVRATTHAQMMTTATLLARGKVVAVEDIVLQKGFQNMDQTQEGTFEEEGAPLFSWQSKIEKIELPTDGVQKAQKQAGDLSQKKDPMQALTGMVGTVVGGFIEPIRVGLEESVRRVTVRVFWTERGRPQQSIEVVTYLTDPARLDIALGLGAAGAGAGVPGGTGQPGVPGQQTPGQGMPGQPSITPAGGAR